MNKKSESQKYSEDLNEWQKKQYQPGVYTGGKFPPDIKYGAKKVGYIFLVQGFLMIFLGLALMTVQKIVGLLIILASFGSIYGGINKIRRSKK
ncbi:MAG: hypothetical protein ACLFNO_01915 [Parcubacteria group bacterium]